MLILIGISIIVFIIMDPYYFIWKTPETPAGKTTTTEKPAAPKKEKSTPVALTNEKTSAKPRRKIERADFAEWGRDPFVQEQRFLEQPKELNRLKLSGISLRGKDHYALINTRIVRVGDDIEGMTVSAIEPDRVILKYQGKQHILNLGH